MARCIHLHVRPGSRAKGAFAANAFDYITRTGKYDEPGRDPAVYTESGHMPAWAEDDPRVFWDAADLFERANGRLYVSVHFDLPRGLTENDRGELARAFSHDVTDSERLPYTLAIHAGLDEHGEEHYPHAHLMFSERRNDGIERTRAEWFRQANARDPAHGGARKSRATHERDWVEHTRARWADLINKRHEARGRPERVDHRSYKRQGLDREPLPRFQRWAVHYATHGEAREQFDEALAALDREQQRQDLDREIERLEAIRASILREGLRDDDRFNEPRDYSHAWRGQAADELTRGW